MISKNTFYKWHRILGLIALVPVIFWTISGLSHPFMSNWFRPFIPNEVFRPVNLEKMKPVLSIQQVLDQHHIKELRNFGLVKFDKGTYYHVLEKDSVNRYYSANDGSLLPDGDKLYATYLARYFAGDSTSKITAVSLQKNFDMQYQPINRLMPVWKVSFDRADGMDIYVETSQSRLGTFNNNTRKTFLWIFKQFHNWQFLADAGGEQFRIIVLLVIVSIMLLSLISGLTVYGLYWKKFKAVQQKRRESGTEDRRVVHRYHRQIGLIVSFVMLTFVGSGGFHLLAKLHNLGPQEKDFSQLINRDELTISNLKLSLPDSTIKRVALAKFNGNTYYQVTTAKKQTLYFAANNGAELQNGDEQFAIHLAAFYRSGQPQKGKGKPQVTLIKKFDNEYGFINKRLPVEKVAFADGEHWYVETSTAKLAEKVAGIDRAEGFSFAFFHKYLGMTWAGKNIRDLVSMLAAFGVLVVAIFGFISFLKNK